MKKLTILAFVAMFMLAAGSARAQQIDFAFGVGTTSAPGPNNSFNGLFATEPLASGAYPAFSGDVLLFKNFGIGGNLAWRASQATYAGSQPYRPIFWDIDGMYVPRIGKHAAVEFSAGIGAESTRFYTPFINCNFVTCTNYNTSTHFLGQFGAGLKLYAHGGFFIRPEAHLYLVNNNVEFTGARVVRYGGSIGYTFGGNH